jgi:hypothetical protein
MAEEFVIHNGVRMIAGWPQKIEEAQDKKTYFIDRNEWARIRYGDESDDWGADSQPCHDCGVIIGQYHVPFLCDVERCPVCDGQVISCDCQYEGDDEE